MSGRNISYGRGGAGNIASITRQHSATTPTDLITPTIKQDVYTTGRGGQGNMVHNDPERPEIARERQDVASPPMRAEQYPHHTGRGGAANAYIPTAEEEERARQQAQAQGAELMRVHTQSQDRNRETEHERQDVRNQQ
ncbi:hypothetical protein N7448_007179 [Penicillium atrosanguineum]|uniref:Uncharacterized protein n=1 Tax=Penicillium atrosanguineum TaxID=1132637 RepID=A0A9W9U2E1_9EURO|nr:uncharacterized protein N7443_010943 [Penicillium atrosanguineum]KAJ5133021.1 hypothetical protein N7448_007179 [Penicillium atrosanguineum]KAJ5141086.1 hypothetical protein N7526_002081 [Penicillium atrosanguineum]KAJ5290690.1 hypothetical protein N7443_010943 [Penicillium atrosanguineum]KAJ5308512.1 hypothetical protein N7476_009168 [Penicillium atrosanguineum]